MNKYALYVGLLWQTEVVKYAQIDAAFPKICS